MATKTPRQNQNYNDDYWETTFEYTNIHDEQFRGTLEIVKEFIERNSNTIINAGRISQELYQQVQETVHSRFPKTDVGSARKALNGFVKLGFVAPCLTFLHPDVDRFLEARTNKRRQTVFSKIVYERSNFRSAVTKDNDRGQLELLIKTLEEVGKLCKDDIIALMLTGQNVDLDPQRVTHYPAGFLTDAELDERRRFAGTVDPTTNDTFAQRKYNQIAFLRRVLKQLDGLTFAKDHCLYFTEDAERLFPTTRDSRDKYRHMLMRNQLDEETEEALGHRQCMVEGIGFPTLINSHIKRWELCSDDEGYDPMNGLYLSETLNGLFDKGWIAFDDNGKMIFSKELPDDVRENYKAAKINDAFLKPERKKFLEWNRDNWFKYNRN